MGCQVCRQTEPEANFLLPDRDIKNLDIQTQNSSEKKEVSNNFINTFENVLPTFGNYFGSDFNTLISPKIQEYMTEHPQSLPEGLIDNTHIYEMKAVEFTNGNVYKGGWNSDIKMEGQGKYYLKDVNVLAEGVWKEGNLIYGRVFISKENDLFDIYEGKIRFSTFNGKGKLILSNGMIYEGDFEDGEKNGNCKIIFEDGTIYEGQVEKGVLKGDGKMNWKNGYEYEGSFQNNKLNGRGVLKGPTGDMGNILIAMEIPMKVNFYMELKKEKAYINVIMYMNMMVIGIMIYLAELVNYLIGKKIGLSNVLGDMVKL